MNAIWNTFFNQILSNQMSVADKRICLYASGSAKRKKNEVKEEQITGFISRQGIYFKIVKSVLRPTILTHLLINFHTN